MVVQSATAVDEALRRIESTDRTLQAWAFVATTAREAEVIAGPLSGMPFGVKDIIDVARMPTAYGMWREHRKARLDAWCVSLLRAAGAIPVGKTRTTAHAYRDPAPTFNPLDPARTPGGSSAGSAAAVAAGQVPFALGTQTLGSVLRPAAYCGVVGFKPTYGRIPTAGVAPLAPSLDHVGVIASDVELLRRVADCLIPGLHTDANAAPRLAVAEDVFAERWDPQTVAATKAAIEKLRAAGMTIVDVTLPEAIAQTRGDAERVVAYEAYTALAPLLAHALPTELRGLLHRGADVPRPAYIEALDQREVHRASVNAFLAGFDAVIVPAGNPAPSRGSTGDGSPYAPWSYFGTPAISVPIPGTAPAALALQLVAIPGSDADLLATAAAVEAALA
jgi:amidase